METFSSLNTHKETISYSSFLVQNPMVWKLIFFFFKWIWLSNGDLFLDNEGTLLGPLFRGSVKEIRSLRVIGPKAASTFPFLACGCGCSCWTLATAFLFFSFRVILNGTISRICRKLKRQRERLCWWVEWRTEGCGGWIYRR